MNLENITIILLGEAGLSVSERDILFNAIATLPLGGRASTPAVMNASLLIKQGGMPEQTIYLTPAESNPFPKFEFDLKNLPKDYMVSFCFGEGITSPLITITESHSPSKRMYCIFSEP
jgi:hypothetical protein